MAKEASEKKWKFRSKRQVDGSGPTNEQRAQWAGGAIEHYASSLKGEQGEPVETQIVDLMSDLAHLCDKHGLDFDDVVTTAHTHWAEER